MLNSAALNHRSMGIASLHPSYANGSGVCFNVGWVEACRRYPPIRLHRGVNPFYFPVVADYRRNFIPGGSYFFTVNLADRRSRLLTDKIGLLRSALRTVMQRHPFTTEAVVVLPEHLHCIWTLPPGDTDFATRWRLIKTDFSKQIGAGERRSPSRVSKGERGIWQRRFWEHTLRDENDFARHCDYIHFNPVKHRHVSRVSAWPHSSFQRFVRLGLYPLDWGGDAANDGAGFGER